MIKQAAWMQTFLQSNAREKHRLRSELSKMQGGLQLLMKPRNGQKWSKQDRDTLLKMLRAASAISPYLIVLALPGSIFILPLLAWHLDVRRSQRVAAPPKDNQATADQ